MNTIILNGSGYTLEITPTAKTLKADALAYSQQITAVSDADSCNLAQAKIKTLAGLRHTAEASRKEVKKPVLEIGRQIDAIAADYVREIEAEEVRLSGLVGEWVREQQRKQREAEEAARRERERIERERLEAERKAREAEMAALRAEREASDKARREAEAAKRAAEEAQRKAEEAAKVVQAPAPAPAPAPRGVSEVIDFEVTDLKAFYAKFPQLCTVTVNRGDVLAALQKSLAKNGKLPEVAGLRVFQNLRIGRRAL